MIEVYNNKDNTIRIREDMLDKSCFCMCCKGFGYLRSYKLFNIYAGIIGGGLIYDNVCPLCFGKGIYHEIPIPN